MSSAHIVSHGDGRYQVSGELTFATVRDVLNSAQPNFTGDVGLEIDLHAVTVADSAGLALLIEWYRAATKANKAIRFASVPAQLRALAKISEIDRLLSLNDAAAV